MIFGNFCTKKSKRFDLDGYRAKKTKTKKIEKTVNKPDYSKSKSADSLYNTCK